MPLLPAVTPTTTTTTTKTHTIPVSEASKGYAFVEFVEEADVLRAYVVSDTPRKPRHLGRPNTKPAKP